jgi:RNA polymerase sigma-70 factor (ECF subfamily)
MVFGDKQEMVENLAVRYGHRLRRFLRTRVRNRADIPDLVQEVYLRLLRVTHHEMIRAPEAYLFTVAQHVARQQALQLAAQPEQVDLNAMLEELRGGPDGTPELEASAAQCLTILQDTLTKLSPNVQSTFLLHRRDGLTIDEVSARLGVSRPMAKKYLVKALVRFRGALQDIE